MRGFAGYGMRVLDMAAGAVMLASMIFNDPPLGIDRGWEEHRTCRLYLKDRVECRHLAEEVFRRHFPALTYEWPPCGKDDMAEAVLWAATSDPGFVDRYMEFFRRLCVGVR